METRRKNSPLSPFPGHASEVRVPPQDLDAEQSVLGAMMLSQEAIRTAIPIIKSDDFYREAHRKLFEAMVTLDDRKESVDIITLSNELKRMEEYDTVGGVNALTALVDRVPTAANIEYYAQIVREKAMIRRLITAATMVVSEGYSDTMPAEQILDYAEHKILEATERKAVRTFRRLGENTSQGEVEKTATTVIGVPSGFKTLDEITSGFQAGDLVIIGARPSIGKTSLALNISLNAGFGRNVLKKKYKIGFFSLEMTEKQIASRITCSEARTDVKRLRAGCMNPTQIRTLIEASLNIFDSGIFIDDTSSPTIMEIKAKARRLKREQNIDLLLIDYMQLIKAGIQAGTREQEVAYISQQLKAMAKDLQIPVVVLSQLSRPQKGFEDRRPVLSDLRESGAIEQDADVVLFIHKERMYYEDITSGGKRNNEYELIVAKQRNGPTGILSMNFIPEFTTFEMMEEEK